MSSDKVERIDDPIDFQFGNFISKKYRRQHRSSVQSKAGYSVNHLQEMASTHSKYRNFLPESDNVFWIR